MSKQVEGAPIPEFTCKKYLGRWFIVFGDEPVAMCTREPWALRILAMLRGDLEYTPSQPGEAPDQVTP